MTLVRTGYLVVRVAAVPATDDDDTDDHGGHEGHSGEGHGHVDRAEVKVKQTLFIFATVK